MKLSRRKFMGTTAAGVASAPLLLNTEAAAELAPDDIDWSMGFPDGSTLLNRNENPIGPSPKAVQAAKKGVEKSFRYADRILIRKLLAEEHGVPEDHVIVGVGSGEILNIMPLVYMREANKNMVAVWESYRPVPGRATLLGGEVKWVNLLPEEDYQFNVDRLLAAVDADTRLLFLVTPNNPTGAVMGYDDVKRLADNLPDHVKLIIDGAYRDFQNDGRDEIELIKGGNKNILVTRTFSKIYAMAGLRAGYGIAHPDIIKELSKFGGSPTSVNMAGFGAMAASLGDDEFIAKSRGFVKNARSYFERELGALGINTMAGPPIFILAEFGERTQEIVDALKARKIFIRAGGEWGMPNHARISYGLDHENATLIAALKEIL
ncbi:pyridoxal phosphate-dependent aminotransferase [Pseudemcibacter aquimaris]|uniref:pyridoxal phosphate-dependent aminotransferase n=1 Tax=Pseudemcibacter aquimaris TaxID=2857064 RepID=UPI0020114EAC|nr:histidinol-phosphate transaminase [Pseudemcibacter aquimaris]MCC3859894.1 aminotransferase class I/II-fold pyridoxal phosphate-dependent enzyme [Pseudemcibacter aquimaris]WDU57226.1 aminotransferase class I/II-fold pyridoxal phosphate-dependent enzyme [Pseudemcibacter aquimaris]